MKSVCISLVHVIGLSVESKDSIGKQNLTIGTQRNLEKAKTKDEKVETTYAEVVKNKCAKTHVLGEIVATN